MNAPRWLLAAVLAVAPATAVASHNHLAKSLPADGHAVRGKYAFTVK